MAYSPIGQGGGLLRNRTLVVLAKKREVTPAQIALAWVLQQSGVIAIPKASSLEHLRANAAARGIKLTSDELADLNAAFPPPRKKQELAML